MSRRDRYAATFRRLAAAREGAFVPFTVLGDPDPETSLAVLRAFVAGGADMLELGIPFSDPVADGPAIQAADRRALAAGVTPAGALDLVAALRAEAPHIPIGLLVYANLVFHGGAQAFYAAAARAGVDSVLVADLPLEEARPFRRAARAAGVRPVALVTPSHSDARIRLAAAVAGPYLYVVGRTGVTGADRQLASGAAPLLGRIRALTATPTLLGFGIATPAHVGAALRAGATGAICGSALVERIAAAVAATPGAVGALPAAARTALAVDMQAAVAALKAATR